MPELHRLLQRQLERSGLSVEGEGGQQERDFIDLINRTYQRFESEITLHEKNSAQMLGQLSDTNNNLQEIVDTLDGFNYHLSHDLKSSMINNVSLARMLRKYYDQGKHDMVEELIVRLERNAKSGLTQIEKYLEVAKFENRIKSAPRSDFEVADMARQLCEDLQLTEKLTVTVNPIDYHSLYMDEISLRSLLQNFITNAYKYKRPDVAPTLTIDLTIDDSKHVLTICDNGIGMDLEKAGDSLFKPFVRLDNSDAEGSGVGLFLVKKIIRNLGGYITVDSVVNEGTCFTIKFPQHD